MTTSSLTDDDDDVITTDQWRQLAAVLRDQAIAEVTRAFGWLDAEVASGSDDGTITVILAAADLEDGRPLHSVLHDVLLAARRGVPATCACAL